MPAVKRKRLEVMFIQEKSWKQGKDWRNPKSLGGCRSGWMMSAKKYGAEEPRRRLIPGADRPRRAPGEPLARVGGAGMPRTSRGHLGEGGNRREIPAGDGTGHPRWALSPGGGSVRSRAGVAGSPQAALGELRAPRMCWESCAKELFTCTSHP